MSKPRTLLLPMYSCRDKGNGNYKLFSDGNFHAWVNMYFPELIRGEMALGIPHWVQTRDTILLQNKFPEIAKNCVRFVYGKNPLSTRKHFWLNDENVNTVRQFSRIICGVSGPADVFWDALLGHEKCTYLMNVSQQLGVEQPIDELHDQEICSASLFDRVYIHDEGQFHFARDLYGKLEISPKHLMFRPAYYARIGTQQLALNRLADQQDKELVLVTVRLSDPEYDFSNKLYPYMLDNTDKFFVLTDPNGHARNQLMMGGIVQIANMAIIEPSKAQYYHLLSLAPKVLYSPNPRIYHVSKDEFTKFCCDIIDI